MADGRVVIATDLDPQGAIDGMHDLEREMRNSGSTVTASANDTSNKVVSTFSQGLNGVKSALGRIAKLAIAAFSVKALVSFGSQAVEMASDLTEVQNVVDTAFASMSYKMENFAKTAVKTYGISELTAKQTGSTYMAMADGLGLSADKASDMAISLTGLSADMASFYNVRQDVADTALKSVFTGETETLKQFGIVMTQANLQQFALSQGIKTSVQNMSQAEQVQLRYAYVMQQTSLAQGDFAKTSGSYANQVRVLKEQWSQFLGILGQGLIQIMTPIIQGLNSILTYLIKIAQKMAQVFGFNMKSTSQDVNNTAKSTKNLTNNTNKLTKANKQNAKATKKAAKVAKGAVSDFDDLNIITSQNASGTSNTSTPSGSTNIGTPSGNTSSMLPNTEEESKNGDKLIAIFDRIKAKFQELKNLFAQGFKIGLGEGWQQSIANIKSDLLGIGAQLKNIFTDADVTKSATTYTNSITLALRAVTGSVASIGLTIGENLIGGLKRYLQQNSGYIKERIISIFDVQSSVALQVAALSTSIADIFSVFRGEQAKQITANIIGIFSNAVLGITDICSKLGSDVINLISSPIIDNKDKIKKAFENTLKPINTVLTTLKDSVTTTMQKINEMYDKHISPMFESLATGFSSITGKILDVYNQYFAPVLDKLTKKFKQMWEENVQPMLNKAVALIGSVADLVKALWENILQPLIEWVVTNILPKLAPIFETIGNLFINLFGSISKVVGDIIDVIMGIVRTVTGVFSGDWSKAWDGIVQAFSGIFRTIIDIVGGVWQAIKDSAAVVGSVISGAFSTAWEVIKGVFSVVATWFTDNVWGPIKTVFSGVKDWFSEKFSAAWSAITGAFVGVGKWFKENVWEKMAGAIGNVKDWFSEKFKGAWEGIKSAFTNVKKWFTNNVVAKFKAAFTGIKEWFSGVFSTAWTAVKGVFGGVKKFFKGVWSNITSVFGNVASWFKEKFSAAWGAVKKVFSAGGKVFSGIKDGILNGLKTVINALIKGINKVIKIPFDGLNKALQKIKDIKILGAKPFSFLPKIGVPQIPKLATGAVLPPNKPFLSVVGDQKRGTNIEAPLDTIKQALLEVMTQQSNASGDIVINIDGREVFRAVQKEAKNYTNRTGQFAF